MDTNFDAGLAFVWLPQHDSPRQGYHVTPGDAGGGTKGGITQMTWDNAARVGLVRAPTGTLEAASDGQLACILRALYWSDACDKLNPGIDLLLFNGRMMTGFYPHLLQTALGLTGRQNDGFIGPLTIATARMRDAETLIHALTGIHYAYLIGLSGWAKFGHGWSLRLEAARAAALLLLQPLGDPPNVAHTDA